MNTRNPGATSTSPPVGNDWASVLLAVWVVISPFVLGFSANPAARWNNVAVGLALILVALLSAAVDWGFAGLNVALGAWLFASPFVLNFSRDAFLCNNVLLAFAVIAAAALAEGFHPARSK